MFKIICDTREKIAWSFSSNFCEELVHKKLDTGDYSIEGLEDKLCIERKKSISEFAGNVSSSAFLNELERMRKYEYKYLILEFSVDDVLQFPLGCGIPKQKRRLIKISAQYIMRRISEIQVEYGVHVIFAGDLDNALYIASNIMKRVYEKNTDS